MRYYLMFIFNPFFGHLFVLASMFANEPISIGLSVITESSGRFWRGYFLSLIAAYVIGFLPSFVALWFFVSITEHIDQFMIRLIIAPFTGLVAVLICSIPFSFTEGSYFFHSLFIFSLEAATFASFVSTLVFDSPFIRRRIPY